jgi:hypothetical protein
LRLHQLDFFGAILLAIGGTELDGCRKTRLFSRQRDRLPSHCKTTTSQEAKWTPQLPLSFYQHQVQQKQKQKQKQQGMRPIIRWFHKNASFLRCHSLGVGRNRGRGGK